MNKLLDLYTNKNQAFLDAIDNLAVNIHLKKKILGFTSITLCGATPAAGTTTMAINLAISTSLSGWKTILIDADLRKGTKYKRLNDKVEVGLANYLKDDLAVKDIIYATNYEGLHYIPCGTIERSTVSLLCSQRLELLHEILKSSYDFVFFDASALNTTVDASIIASVTDTTVILVGYGMTEKEELQSAITKLKASGANILGAAVNIVNLSEYETYLKDYDYYKKSKFRKTARKV